MTNETNGANTRELPARADVVVVGGGAAGAIVASRLSEDPGRSVLLLEAGPDFPDADELPGVVRYGVFSEGTVTTRDFCWVWPTVPQVDGADPYPILSGKVIGGGSSINGQVWLRALPDDFDAWAAAGAPNWAWSKVAPWYAEIETDLDFPTGGTHGHDGLVGVRRFAPGEWHPIHRAFHEGARAAGFEALDDLNDPAAVRGVGAQPFNNVDGVRLSSSLTYLAVARGRQNLTVVGDTEVRRVLFDGTRAVGVLVRTQDGSEKKIFADEVILSAGSIASPWLLLRSGIGPAAELDEAGIPLVADLAGVGRRLQEHPRIGLRWRPAAGVELDETAGPYQIAVRLTASSSTRAGDLKIASTAVPGSDGGSDVQVYVYLMSAKSMGVVRLNPDDVDASPIVEVRLLEDADDLRRIVEGVRTALDISRTGEFGSVLGDRLAPTAEEAESEESLGTWARLHVSGTFHPSSTCAMGAVDDPTAVVDESGRVRGVRGLRVIDGSIIPLSVRANNNATIYMLADRIASGIRDRAW